MTRHLHLKASRRPAATSTVPSAMPTPPAGGAGAPAQRTPALGDFVTREELRALHARRDRPGLARVGLHLALLVAGGVLVHLAWGSPWLAAAFVVDGFVIVHLFALLHECAHRSAFRTAWLNRGAGTLAGYAIALPPFHFRLEHVAHHAYTQDPERDPELIALPRTLAAYALWLSSVQYWWVLGRAVAAHVRGRLVDGEQLFVRTESDRRRVVLEARFLVALYLAAIVASLAAGSDAFFVYWLVPRLVGEPFMRGARIAEHAGRPLARDITENTRTFSSSPPVRLLSYNMNFHAEHHAAPSVPFHGLPRLHERFGPHVKNSAGGYLAAQRDIVRRIRAGTGPGVDTPWAAG